MDWVYCTANAAIFATKNTSAMKVIPETGLPPKPHSSARGLRKRANPAGGLDGSGARYRSIAAFVRGGPASTSGALSTVSTNDVSACHLYGHKYFSSRFIRRES